VTGYVGMYLIVHWLRIPDSLAKPNQVKVVSVGGDLREAQVDVHLLLTTPALDHIAGLYNRHLNRNRGICLR